MSGPKSGNWRVVRLRNEREAAESRRRAQEQLQYYLRCIKNFEEELQRVLAEHPELQIDYRPDALTEPSDADAQAITTELNKRYEIYRRLQGFIESTKGTLKAKDAADDFVKFVVRSRSQSATQASVSFQDAQATKAIQERATELLSTILPGVSAEHRTQVEEIIKRCLETSDTAMAQLQLAELRQKVRDANRIAKAQVLQLEALKKQDAAKAQNLLLALDNAGIDSEDALAQELLAVTHGDSFLQPEMVERAREAVSAAEKSYAGQALRTTLEALGYEVADDFQTIFSQGGSVYFQRPSWKEHYVQVSAHDNDNQLMFNVVRHGEGAEASSGQAVRDREMEQQWCGEVDGLLHSLSDAGVAIDLTRRIEAGLCPVQVVKNDKLRSKGTARQEKRQGYAQQQLK